MHITLVAIVSWSEPCAPYNVAGATKFQLYGFDLPAAPGGYAELA
jgi:hypothetical protein